MSNRELQGRAAFQDRVARIRTEIHPDRDGALLVDPYASPSQTKPAGESAQDLQERIQATLATDTRSSSDARPGKRFIGLPLVVGSLGLLFVMFFMRQPVEDVSSVIEPRSNGLFPAFSDLQPEGSSHAGSKTISARSAPRP